MVEYAPDSKEAEIFRKLATEIMENDSRVIPTPINDLVELETMFRQHLERNKNWENEDDQSFVERTNSLFMKFTRMIWLSTYNGDLSATYTTQLSGKFFKDICKLLKS